ncbi:hypothetical protein [Thalassospira australica]|uniref:hypothetical protein n=1 Tax=Thalassospira australica TaxID=1528106 RepID=UPI0012E09D79|nr:hypothetical protein [Thalassospira australica]
MLLFVIFVRVLSLDQGTRNRARSMAKALGARDLSPLARLLTTEKFMTIINLWVKWYMKEIQFHPKTGHFSGGFSRLSFYMSGLSSKIPNDSFDASAITSANNLRLRTMNSR